MQFLMNNKMPVVELITR